MYNNVSVTLFFPKQLWTSDTQGDEAEAGEGGEN